MKKVICIFLIFVSCIFISSCGVEGYKNYENNANLIQVPHEKNLYYENNTKIIYFLFNEVTGKCGYGYMSPYYSENGNLCKWDTVENKIVEIEK